MRTIIRAGVFPLALLATIALIGCGGGGGGNSSGSSSTGGSTTLSSFVLQPIAEGDPKAGTNNTLTWTPSSGATGITYDVYRTTTGAFPATPISSGLAGTTYSDSTATVGTTYYYKVVANAPNATSVTSTISSAGTDRATFGGPTSQGVGDPAGCTGSSSVCLAPGSVFTGSTVTYSMSSGSAADFSISASVDPTILGHAPVKTDLQSVSIGGKTYDRATLGAAFDNGITVGAKSINFDSGAAGITVPSAYEPITQGTLYTFSAVVAGQKMQLTAPAPAPPGPGNITGIQFFPVVNGGQQIYTVQFSYG